MKARALGRDGLAVTPMVLGTMAYGQRADLRARASAMRAALDAGISAVDTAPLYHFGRIERMLGELLQGRDVAVLGKAGLRWDDEHGDVLFATDIDGRRVVVRKDGRPRSVRRDVETSLQALRRDRLQLCQIHHPDPHVPLSDTFGELLRLRDEGKVEHVGACNFSTAQLREAQAALGEVPLCSHQFEFSLLALGGAESTRRAAAMKIGARAYSPLHRGALAGRVRARGRRMHDDPRRSFPAYVGRNAEAIDAALASAVAPVAARHRASAAQVALAWLLHEPGLTAVVAGVSTPGQARDTVEAARLELSEAERGSIRRAFEGVRIDPRARPRKRDRVERKLRRVAAALLRRARGA